MQIYCWVEMRFMLFNEYCDASHWKLRLFCTSMIHVWNSRIKQTEKRTEFNWLSNFGFSWLSLLLYCRSQNIYHHHLLFFSLSLSHFVFFSSLQSFTWMLIHIVAFSLLMDECVSHPLTEWFFFSFQNYQIDFCFMFAENAQQAVALDCIDT